MYLILGTLKQSSFIGIGILTLVDLFRCLAGGEIPPVKERLEYPCPPSESGLTPGLLRVLNKQMGRQATVQKINLKAKWRGICLASHHLEEILELGTFGYNFTLDVQLFKT